MPAGHIVQVNVVPGLLLEYPGKHLLQEVWTPSLVFPSVQAIHEVFDGRFWYSPSLQAVQDASVGLVKTVPAEHSVQVKSPPETSVLKLPDLHLLQDK